MEPLKNYTENIEENSLRLLANSASKAAKDKGFEILNKRISDESSFIIVKDEHGKNYSIKIQPY